MSLPYIFLKLQRQHSYLGVIYWKGFDTVTPLCRESQRSRLLRHICSDSTGMSGNASFYRRTGSTTFVARIGTAGLFSDSARKRIAEFGHLKSWNLFETDHKPILIVHYNRREIKTRPCFAFRRAPRLFL